MPLYKNIKYAKYRWYDYVKATTLLSIGYGKICVDTAAGKRIM
jgi:hypothetical protein